jgi:methyl-accepting chemotaxis protein
VQTLNEIATKARQVDELVSAMADASREQTEGITQINIAVSQMDKVTQTNAASAEENAAAAEELNAQAETMKQSVTELQQLVGGTRTEAAKKAASQSAPGGRGAMPPPRQRIVSSHGHDRSRAVPTLR